MNFEFFEQLASDSPTPGGGTASAYSAAMGAALLAMVAKLSVKTSPEAERFSVMGEAYMKECYRLADADARAFGRVVSAYKLPKKSEFEDASRRKAIEEALKEATRTPYATALHSIEILKITERFLPQANPNALSDLGVAAHFAKTGVQGAIYNVLINIAGIKDRDFVKRYSEGVKVLKEESETRSTRILKSVEASLSAPLKAALG